MAGKSPLVPRKVKVYSSRDWLPENEVAGSRRARAFFPGPKLQK